MHRSQVIVLMLIYKGYSVEPTIPAELLNPIYL